MTQSDLTGFTVPARQTWLWLHFNEDLNKSLSEALGSFCLRLKVLDGPVVLQKGLLPLRQVFDGKVRLYKI